MVTRQLQVERRTGKVRRSKTNILPLCQAGLWLVLGVGSGFCSSEISFYLNLRSHLIGLLSDRSSICGLCSCHKLTSDGAVWTGLRHARQVAVTVAMQSLVVERTGHDSGTVRRYGDLLYTPTLLTKFVARILLIYCQTSSLIFSE